MRHINYFLIIVFIHSSLLAMDVSGQSPEDKPGFFLDQIVSEYKDPVRISQLPLEPESYTERGFRQYSCREDLHDRIKHLAVVAGNQTHFFKREIETIIQNASGCDGLCFVETACLRVEDLSNSSKKTFIWLSRYVNNSENKNKLKASMYGDSKILETLEFNRENALRTLITLKLTDTDYLRRNTRNKITVESKTNNFLDPIIQKLFRDNTIISTLSQTNSLNP